MFSYIFNFVLLYFVFTTGYLSAINDDFHFSRFGQGENSEEQSSEARIEEEMLSEDLRIQALEMIDTRYKYGNTFFIKVASNNDILALEEVLPFLSEIEIREALAKQNEFGTTAIMMAINSDNIDIARKFLDIACWDKEYCKYLLTELESCDGLNAVSIARRCRDRGKPEAEELLKSYLTLSAEEYEKMIKQGNAYSVIRDDSDISDLWHLVSDKVIHIDVLFDKLVQKNEGGKTLLLRMVEKKTE